MVKQYFLAQNGRISGPFAATQLKQRASEGTLSPNALVSEDRRNWVSATDVKGLSFRNQRHPTTNASKQTAASCRREAVVAPLAHPAIAAHVPVATETVTPSHSDHSACHPTRPATANNTASLLQDSFARALVLVEEGKQRLLADRPIAHRAHPPAAKFDVFLSYRRRDGSEIARLVAEKLERIGYRVFLDVEGLTEGDWSADLEARIRDADDFVPIITGDFFTRCENPSDVVHKEVALALATGKNVVPFIATEHPFPPALPADIQSLPHKNGVRYVHEYADHAIAKLSSMLHSGRVGPTRLETSELSPKIVVTSVGLLLGFLYGASAAYSVGMYQPFWSLFGIVVTSIMGAISSMLVFALPLLVIQAFAAAFFQFRPDKYFGGREWAGFWLIFCPLVVFPTTFLVPFATTVFASWSYIQEAGEDYARPTMLTRIIAVLLALSIAFATTQLIIRSRAATIAARAVGAMR